MPAYIKTGPRFEPQPTTLESSSLVNNVEVMEHWRHRLNIELDLQYLFGLNVHSCHLGSFTRALLVSQDRRHLFVTPCGKDYLTVHIKNEKVSQEIVCRKLTALGIYKLFTDTRMWKLGDRLL